MTKNQYFNNITRYSRIETNEVVIGDVAMGGKNPIRIQSMTNTSTNDVQATVDQCIRIINAGADYVRITVPSVKDTENLRSIHTILKEKGYHAPLIADIHFNPKIAEIAATIVEKVRINPGNFAGSKKDIPSTYSDDEYFLDFTKAKEKFIALLNICKKHGTAVRIGVNHGSLSNRIVSRYGDTPAGMVESAMELLRICKEEAFSNVVLSMKASNTIVMVQATRLLVIKMKQENMLFPIHLGVTEAGAGEQGRIKSSVGIGALLADGIGDTIRVSLTEEPENEIPVAAKLVDHVNHLKNETLSIKTLSKIPVNTYEYRKRKTCSIKNIGGRNVPVVIADFSLYEAINSDNLHEIGWITKKNEWTFNDLSADYIYLNNIPDNIELPDEKSIITKHKNWLIYKDVYTNIYPLLTLEEYFTKKDETSNLCFVRISYHDLSSELVKKWKNDTTAVLVVESDKTTGFHKQRALVFELMNNNCLTPVIFKSDYSEKKDEDFRVKSAADLGCLFLDGLGDGIWLTNEKNLQPELINSTAFDILQACRARISKTEYISCPSCGRTHFNIIETLARIKEKTFHLKGLKIGVMGCIVNGIGEMADAGYGYVGSGNGKITLYKEKKVIRKNIPESQAVDELVKLIKENGDWRSP